MDSEDVKQILIAYHTIESALEAMLKPVTTELNDAESVAKIPRIQHDTLLNIIIDCAAIQKVLSRMADYLGAMEKSIYNDGEIEEVGDKITNILFDVQPIPNQPIKVPKYGTKEYAKAMVEMSEKKTVRVDKAGAFHQKPERKDPKQPALANHMAAEAIGAARRTGRALY